MERLAKLDFAAVVIEGDWRELLLDRPNNVQVPGKVASRTADGVVGHQVRRAFRADDG